MLFDPAHDALSDEEIAAVLRQSIAAVQGGFPEAPMSSSLGSAPSTWSRGCGSGDCGAPLDGGCISELVQ